MPLVLDASGWEQIRDILDECGARVKQAAEVSAQRVGAGKGIEAVIAFALFESEAESQEEEEPEGTG